MPNEIGTEMKWTVPLASISRNDLERAGGKGANLGELVQSGFPVPPGFVVTTDAYEHFVQQHQIGLTITHILNETHRGGAEVSGAAIREAFETASIPGEIMREISSAYVELGEGPVAVRSSATAEDLPGAAFAGQQETYLNIIGKAALLDAVSRCWASLWGDRAIAYRERLGLDQQNVQLAVVIQKMVAADYAGVMFTANPVTGERDAIMIDANPGLGEAVVSGLVTPDHFSLRKQRLGWKITERRSGRREVMIRARSGGGTELVEGALPAGFAALPDKVLRQLVRLGMAIQNHFGPPQDIEWAWADQQIYILQARPITALPDPPPHANLPQRLLANNFGEMIPSRPYPLDLDTWLPALSSAVDPIFTALGLKWHMGQMFETEDQVVIRLKTSFPQPTWKILYTPARLILLAFRYNPLRWQFDLLLVDTCTRVRAMEKQDVRALSWVQLLDLVRATKAIPFLVAGEIRRRYFPRAVFAVVRLRLMLGLLGESSQLLLLLSGVENKTVEANHGLERLADQVRADPELMALFSIHEPQQLMSVLADHPAGRAFLEAFHAFLDDYGHRETTLSTALHPTWKDAPAVVLGMIKSFAAHPLKPRTDQPAWRAARDALLKHHLLRFGPFRSGFLKTLTEARTLLQIREDTHFNATLALPLFRRTFLEMGRRLIEQGIVDQPEDIFHLSLGELEGIRDEKQILADTAEALRGAIHRRKQARVELEGIPLVDPRLFPHALPTGDALLNGMPGSPGVAEGPVRIIRNASEFDQLAAGEVLVAPYTNPSWTPLFQRAAAVIVDSGSAASHAAIVAREYGIPAVMSTVTGTKVLHNGERIRVDGNQGLVFRLSDTASITERNGKTIDY